MVGEQLRELGLVGEQLRELGLVVEQLRSRRLLDQAGSRKGSFERAVQVGLAGRLSVARGGVFSGGQFYRGDSASGVPVPSSQTVDQLVPHLY